MDLRTAIKASLAAMLGMSVAVGVSAENDQGDEREESAADLGALQVTARRVEETIQDVPVSVTAFTEDNLRDLQATRFDDLQNAVPNVNIAQGRASASSVNAFIRGIGQPDALQTFDPGVGIYVDDVYLSRIQGGLMNLYDVERVEVLRGPQGTLYGKNSPGGAIKVVTRTPRYRTEGIAEVMFGDYGLMTGNFYVGGALGDVTSASFAGRVTRRDGFVTDPVTGREYNDDQSEAMRAKVHFEPSPDFNMTVGIDYTRERNAATLGQQQEPLISVDLATGGIVVRYVPDGEEFDFRTRSNLESGQGQDLDHWGITAAWDWMLNDNWNLKGITGYRELETDFWIEFDNTELSMSEALVALDQDQFSQELQLHYNNYDNFRGVMGVFYMKENVPSEQMAIADDFLLLGGAPLDFLRTIDDDLTTTSYAAFAHGTWDFADRWSFSLGGRYSTDEKDYARSTSTFSEAFPALDGTYAFTDSESWSAFTPSASLQYDFADNMMGYVSASRGFKSGGFNGRANAPGDTGSFDPEFVWSYEAGLKATFMDGRLLTNWAAFRSDYEDFQARVAEDIDSFPVLNAGKLRIEGVELEAVAMLPSNTTLSAQIGYMDARYVEFFDARFDGADRSDDNVPFAPDWTLRLGAIQNFNLANGAALIIGGDIAYRGDTWLSVDNQPNLFQESFWLANALVRYQTADRDWEFFGGVRNLTDEVYKVDAQEFSSVANIQGAFFGAPRTWHVGARYNF
jgi:iron complex outermembrane recepter protein